MAWVLKAGTYSSSESECYLSIASIIFFLVAQIFYLFKSAALLAPKDDFLMT